MAKGRQESSGPIFVVSGATGASGEQLVRTALAQFGESDVAVTVVPRVRRKTQVESVVKKASKAGGTIYHTLVDAKRRQYLAEAARQQNVVAIDVIGPVLSSLSDMLGQQPEGHPGLYGEMHEEYLHRIEAIEFAVAHDDGRGLADLHLAEIVLVGVSRSGKTPLCMYLGVRGWKAANVPLVPNVPHPAQLDEVDRQRMVGLTVSPDRLARFRRQRIRRLGETGETSYTGAVEIDRELSLAQQWFRRRGVPVIDVTSKPIEETADEVLALIGRGGGEQGRGRGECREQAEQDERAYR